VHEESEARIKVLEEEGQRLKVCFYISIVVYPPLTEVSPPEASSRTESQI
jgi:hypothetical protein